MADSVLKKEDDKKAQVEQSVDSCFLDFPSKRLKKSLSFETIKSEETKSIEKESISRVKTTISSKSPAREVKINLSRSSETKLFELAQYLSVKNLKVDWKESREALLCKKIKHLCYSKTYRKTVGEYVLGKNFKKKLLGTKKCFSKDGKLHLYVRKDKTPTNDKSELVPIKIFKAIKERKIKNNIKYPLSNLAIKDLTRNFTLCYRKFIIKETKVSGDNINNENKTKCFKNKHSQTGSNFHRSLQLKKEKLLRTYHGLRAENKILSDDLSCMLLNFNVIPLKTKERTVEGLWSESSEIKSTSSSIANLHKLFVRAQSH